MEKQAFIYKITDIGYTECYYGSTIQPLHKRMYKHRVGYKYWLEGKESYVSSYSLFKKYGVENCKIELVEVVHIQSRSELRQKEGEYIKNNPCVNKNTPARNCQEYYEKVKEKVKKTSKTYHHQQQAMAYLHKLFE